MPSGDRPLQAAARTRPGRLIGPTSALAIAAAMTKPEPTDPNAELRDFEPLRVVLALGALLLGLVMSIH